MVALVAALLIAGVSGGCGRQGDVDGPAATTRPGGVWWRQDTVATWTGFGKPAHEKWLEFIKEIGTTACDRGLSSAHADGPGVRASIADYYHKRGLRLTSFMSIPGWRPDDEAVAKLIARMRRELDDGCDGVHLDMLFGVADPKRNVMESDAAARAVAKMRDAVGAHRRKPRAMFAGNVWKLDTKFSLQTAALCDVAWIESWGHDDLELVRMARVARSLGGGGKVTWYHWQPNDNEQARVEKLANLPRALYSSCMAEGAVFLCNYQYPVPVVHRDADGRKITDWRMIPINDRWRGSVVRYARFVKEHADKLRDAEPLAPVIVAFRPGRVAAANRIMRDLLVAGVSFNVHVAGRWPFEELAAGDLAGYQAVVSPDGAWARRAASCPVYRTAATLLAGGGAEIRDFCRIDGAEKVIARVLTGDRRLLVHLKQYGYTDQADDPPAAGPLTLTMHCGREIRQVTCYSPDRPGSEQLEFKQDGPKATITVPKLMFYNLVVLDVAE